MGAGTAIGAMGANVVFNDAVANAVVAQASAPAAAAAPASVTLPVWALVGIAVLALVVALVALARGGPKKPPAEDKKKKHGEFGKALCQHLWKHTDAMTSRFDERLREHPRDVESLRLLVRHLREYISAPVEYVEQMRTHPVHSWPSFALASAFNEWAGQIKSIEKQLADLQLELTYPLVKEPVNKKREAELTQHFASEKPIMRRGIDRLYESALRICNESHAILKEKEKAAGFGLSAFRTQAEDEDADVHAACPCCNRMRADHARPFVSVEPLPTGQQEAAEQRAVSAPTPPAASVIEVRAVPPAPPAAVPATPVIELRAIPPRPNPDA